MMRSSPSHVGFITNWIFIIFKLHREPPERLDSKPDALIQLSYGRGIAAQIYCQFFQRHKTNGIVGDGEGIGAGRYCTPSSISRARGLALAASSSVGAFGAAGAAAAVAREAVECIRCVTSVPEIAVSYWQTVSAILPWCARSRLRTTAGPVARAHLRNRRRKSSKPTMTPCLSIAVKPKAEQLRRPVRA